MPQYNVLSAIIVLHLQEDQTPVRSQYTSCTRSCSHPQIQDQISQKVEDQASTRVQDR